MKKVFLYLYPIKDFYNEYVPFVYSNDMNLSREELISKYKPFEVMSEIIDKRYRQKGYEVVFATFSDEDVFGIEIMKPDRVIKTDTEYSELKPPVLRYPTPSLLVNQLGDIDILVVGGFHATDCVRRIAEQAIDTGIDTLVDLDLTDRFFYFYNQPECIINKENYSPEEYLERYKKLTGPYFEDLEDNFREMYKSPVYGFKK